MNSKQEIIDKSKVVLLPHIDCSLFDDDCDSYDDFMKSHKSFVVDNISNDFLYSKDDVNKHHICTRYHYNYLLPNILNLLGVDFNLYNDFNYIEDINEFGDYGYLLPVKDIKYDINSIKLDWNYSGNLDIIFDIENCEDSHYKDLVSVDKVYNHDFFLNDKWGNKNTWIESKYHKLFKYSHQVCKLENKNLKDGKSILISGDSHSIPLIMPISRYYKTVYFFDNRWIIYFYDYIMGDKYDVDDSLFIMWRNQDINKYLVSNLR